MHALVRAYHVGISSEYLYICVQLHCPVRPDPAPHSVRSTCLPKEAKSTFKRGKEQV